MTDGPEPGDVSQLPVSPRRISPSDALRPGRADAAAVLGTWFLRRSSTPLLVGGAAVATTVLGSQEPPDELGSVAEALGLLLSPWAGVALAVLVRVASGWLAWLVALPLTVAAGPEDDEGARVARWWRAQTDRLRLVRAYRALRWTWPVRELAAQRLGSDGRRLRRLDLAMTSLTVAIVLAWVAAAALTG